MPHTDYSMTQRRGTEGTYATAEPCVTRTSFNNTNGSVPIGRVLVQSGTGSDAMLPSATGQKVVGINVFGDVYEQDVLGNAFVPAKYPMNRLVRGSAYMVAENDLDATSVLHFRHTMKGSPLVNEAIGRVRSGADGVLTDALVGARAEQAVKAGEVFEMVVNFV
jgi:hypothetical protein